MTCLYFIFNYVKVILNCCRLSICVWLTGFCWIQACEKPIKRHVIHAFRMCSIYIPVTVLHRSTDTGLFHLHSCHMPVTLCKLYSNFLAKFFTCCKELLLHTIFHLLVYDSIWPGQMRPCLSICLHMY